MTNEKRGKLFTSIFLSDDRRGLSAIIVTLIMILLVIVAAGIIWVVIRNVVGSGTEQINVGTACLNTNVEATKVTNSSPYLTSPVTYQVTLTRSAGGGEIGGVKIVFTNETGTESYVHTEAGNIDPLATTTVSASGVTITNANQVDVVVYFLDNSGEEQSCSVSNEYGFTL